MATIDAEAPPSPRTKIHLHIGGEPRETGTGGTHDHLNPYSQQVQAQVPLAGAAEVDEAVEKALAVQESWRRTSPEARRDILNRLADLIEAHREDFVLAAQLDNGHTRVAGNITVDFALQWTRYYAGWCDKLGGDLIGTMDTRGEFSYTMPQPIGIVGIIITWNGPLISLAMKVVPALAAGNCVICKPAELNAHVPELFARLCKEAGIPDGVLSSFHGTGEAGEAMIRHRKIRKISFTGGPITARKILHSCAEQIKPTVMELGGKSANIVFPDCDLDAAAALSVFGVFFFGAGQGCALPTRALVHVDIYEAFLEKVKVLMGTLKVGDPADPSTIVGPVMNTAAAERIEGMFERARKDGAANFLFGGHRCGGELAGLNFIEPTLIVDADPDHEISQVEIFGPALIVTKFYDEDEAVAIANNSEYGLAAYIQSSNVERVLSMSERLFAGGVYVNGGSQINAHTPFGGVGISGFGKEGGRTGIDEFLHYKTVTIKSSAR
ncbi:aldehyde dehydrogenase (NAD+) [Sphingobium wenxiniae]|uniref:Aldehyde dehydrogenase (NAD+) n=1 Tax=Sphingobium wenxiniae (strain DSM 21828 / CGMCC 1.7748 / JZ-1) TaxID=595605 RepID=A0A562K4L0_SPHWJ|nr:aldehyde dehydrogenase family protein [Sphingobium wenxiniae]MBB6193286.1 aldehyde dehydrogenase (NAD+) [Sphingobium wenxiniae]TWH90145.1 aldehyde dehydrogenase (NAD+) [Sphingobium wenxiniae]